MVTAELSGNFGHVSLDGALADVESARDLLGDALPRQWRSVSASAYSERLGGLAAATATLVSQVAEARLRVRLMQAELAACRAAGLEPSR